MTTNAPAAAPSTTPAKAPYVPPPLIVVETRRGLFGQDEGDMDRVTVIATDFHTAGKIANGPEAHVAEVLVGATAVNCGPGYFHYRVTPAEADRLARVMAAGSLMLPVLRRVLEAVRKGVPSYAGDLATITLDLRNDIVRAIAAADPDGPLVSGDPVHVAFDGIEKPKPSEPFE